MAALGLSCSMRDLTSPARDWTLVSALEGGFLTTGPLGKSLYNISFKFFSNPTVIFGSRALWIKERIYFLPCTQLVKNLLQCRRPWFDYWVGKLRWRRDRLPTPVFLGFPDGSDGKESACNAGDLSLIPGLGRSPGEGMATHSSILAWRIHGLYSPWGPRVGHDWATFSFTCRKVLSG